jgi:hypothetical protein
VQLVSILELSLLLRGNVTSNTRHIGVHSLYVVSSLERVDSERDGTHTALAGRRLSLRYVGNALALCTNLYQ